MGALLKTFQATDGTPDELNRFQRNVAAAVDPLKKLELLDAVWLQAVALDSARANQVPHGLGRKVRGYVVTRRSANLNVWDEQDENPNPDKTLRLQTSASGSVDLWVF